MSILASQHDPSDVIWCSWCILRAANPMLYSRHDSKAAFCSFACRDAWNAQHDRTTAPEIDVISMRSLRKIVWRP